MLFLLSNSVRAVCPSDDVLKIAEGTTEIADSEYINCSSMKGKIVIPSSVTKIGSYAFYNCKSLTGDIVIPLNVVSIGEYAFSGCSELNGKVSIPSSLNRINDSVFSGCSHLAGPLSISYSVTSIGTYAFYECSKLTGHFSILPQLESIGDYAFAGCEKIFGDTLIIPQSSVSIGEGVFSCQYDTLYFNLRIENDTIMDNFFLHLFSKTNINGNLILTENVKQIGERAFATSNDYGIRGSLKLLCNITSIPNYAFYECSKLTGPLIIPQSVTSIGEYAFAGCEKIFGDTLIIPQTCISIGKCAFNVRYVTMNFNLRIENETIMDNFFTHVFLDTKIKGDLILTESVKQIGERAFAQTNYVYGIHGSLKMLCNITSIPNYAFYECSELIGSLIIPQSVTSIGENAFYKCSGLQVLLKFHNQSYQ